MDPTLIDDVLWTALTFASGVWIVALGLQIGDVSTAWMESQHVRDRADAPSAERRPASVLFWSVSVPALAVLVLAIGVDIAARMVLDGRVLIGFAVLVPLALAIVGVVAGAVVAIGGPTARTYAGLREELRSQLGTRPESEQLDEWRAELASIDARHRSRARRARPRLVSWRALPPVLGAIATVLAVLLAIDAPNPVTVPAAAVSVVLLGVTIVLAVVAERFAARARIAWARVYAVQRAHVVALLDELDRKALKRIPGLGDRVARALAILREQQR